MHRADGHGFEGVDFLGDLHGADLGGKGGAGTADHDDGGNQGPEFKRHRYRNGRGDVTESTQAAQLVSGLQSEDQTNEKGNEGEERDFVNTNDKRLREGELEANRLA